MVAVNGNFSAETRFEKFPLYATEYYTYNIVPSVQSIKLVAIIEAQMGQNGRRSKCATLVCYWGLHKIMIYIDCYRIKGSFD